MMIQGRKKEHVRIHSISGEKKTLICCEVVLVSWQGIKESLLYIKTAQLLVYKNWRVRK